MSAAKMIFCRIANMKNYDGEQAGDIPRGSGSYIEKNKTGC